MKIIIASLAALLCLTLNAEARPHRHRAFPYSPLAASPGCNVEFPCEFPYATRRIYSRTRVVSIAQADTGQVIGTRPAGCPHAYCGCGASIHLFGRIIPYLNLAANWLSFPRAQPAPKMAAVRRGHVLVLEQHIDGDVWLVHDSNAGGGMTRMHQVSIAGYTIVNPRGLG